MKLSNKRAIGVTSALALVVFGLLLGYVMVTNLISMKLTQPITSLAVPKPSTPREVNEVVTNSDGDLIITYTDGTVQNAGRVVGRDGSGQSPTQSQISAALIEYCTNGKCDSKSPTQEQIVGAVLAYCEGGRCKGDAGKDATPITGEQIAVAISSYCANGRCKGDTGATSDSNLISCVTRSNPNVTPVKPVSATNPATINYVAWKYLLEPNTAYRDLYKLPIWAECSNPINLTGVN